jgi:hypothetical protein
MTKSIIEKFKNSKAVKCHLSNYILTKDDVAMLLLFAEKIGFSHDRINFLIQRIKLQDSNWVKKWQNLKLYKQHTLGYFQNYYGDEEGLLRYCTSIKEKRKGLRSTISYWIHHGFSEVEAKKKLIEFQKMANAKAIERILAKDKNKRSCRQLEWWINKGYDREDAKEKLKKVQTHNGYVYLQFKFKDCSSDYIDKMQKRRNEQWQCSLNSNPNNKDIGIKRSHSLARYIERAKGNYLKYRNTLSWYGKASKESLQCFSPLLKILNRNSIEYFIGIAGSKELSIYDQLTKRLYWYDLSIPTYNLIVEYNGETYHPNPKWNAEKWSNWRHPHTTYNADYYAAYGKRKIDIAKSKGWEIIQIFSSDNKLQLIENIIQKY